jgi:hypothetical protein
VVTRRKYKARASAPADVNLAVVAPQAPPVAPQPTAGGGGPSPLQAALQAQQHAESLQHQHAIRQQAGLAEPPLDPATQQAIDAHIDAMPGLTEWKRRFLKSHRSLVTEPYLQSAHHAHAMALRAGVVDDTPAMDHAILAGVAKDVEHHRSLSALSSAQPRPTPQAHFDVNEAAAALRREAEMHFGEHQGASAAPKPQRKSYPMSAPVSRGTPNVSGARSQDRTLTADERQIARASMPHLPPEQAEYQYMVNRRRMHEMKRDGRIQGDG